MFYCVFYFICDRYLGELLMHQQSENVRPHAFISPSFLSRGWLSTAMRRKLFPVPVLLFCLAVAPLTSAVTECELGASTAGQKKPLKIGVLIPHGNKFPWSLPLAGPGIKYALETVNGRTDFLEPVANLSVTWGDSRCSDIYGPLTAFDMYVNESVDAFVGPGCDYALAPIARFSPYWNKPVITGGALVHAFSDKSDYGLLTRISGSYDKLGVAIASLFASYNWTIAGVLYHTNLDRRWLGKSTEFFIMEGIYLSLFRKFKLRYPDRQFWQVAFDENSQQKEMFFNIEALLKDASNNTRSEFTLRLPPLKVKKNVPIITVKKIREVLSTFENVHLKCTPWATGIAPSDF